MKTKLEMAHEYLLRFSGVTVAEAWAYADAMQTEADKRKPSEFPNVLRGACGEIVAVKVDDKEWQPDWSQAPERALTWAINSDGYASWALYRDGHYFSTVQAPSFGYTGDWRNSLRKRPK